MANIQDSTQQIDHAADEVLSILGDDNGADDATDSTGQESNDGAGETGDGEGEDAELQAGEGSDTDASDEAEEPVRQKTQGPTPIEAPASWKAEEKERFKALPPETQKYLVTRENEREALLTNSRKEHAEASRAAQAAQENLQKATTQYTQNLQHLIGLARRMDPVIAEGDALGVDGWKRLFEQDKQAANAKWTEYQLALGQIGAFANELGAAQQQAEEGRVRQDREAFANALQALEADPELGPIWKDQDKRVTFQKDLKTFLTKEGFGEGILASIRDPNILRVAYKAMDRDRIKAQQASIAQQRRPADPGRIMRPKAQGDNEGGRGKAAALFKKAEKTGRFEDAANAVLAALD